MNMARIRHIMAMRRALKAPPLLPPKIKSRQHSINGEFDKKSGPKDIIDINIQIRELHVELVTSGTVACLCFESEDGKDGPWKLVATSDAVPKDSSIDIADVFSIEYVFERTQFVKFEICDSAEDDAKVLGYATFLVSEVVCNSGEFSRDVICEETSELVARMCITFTCRPRPRPVLLQFSAKNISKKGMFGEPQVQFHVSRIEDNGERSVLYKSELMGFSLRMQWKQFNLQSSLIADARSRQLVIECFSQDDRGKRVMIGDFITDLTQLQASTAAQNVFFLTTISSKGGRKTTGTFEVVKCTEMTVYSFLDYILNGSLLHLAIAVDFSTGEQSTSTEGCVNDRSLLDDVEYAIRTIAEPFRYYNFSSNYAAYGFGAKIPPLFRESHQFCLSLETDPHCRGVDGVIDVFRSACSQVQSTSSAHFAHIIYYLSKLADNARKRGDQSRPQYYVLAVITRGAIDDLREAIQAVIFASKAPLSIILVGIGDSNSTELERLGCAGSKLAYHGRRTERDNLQFVSVSKERNKGQSDEEAKESFVERAISRIPWQLATWMMKNGYTPQVSREDADDKQDCSATSTQRGLSSIPHYDSFMSAHSSSNEHLDAPRSSEYPMPTVEQERRSSDERDTCSTSSCPARRGGSANTLLDDRTTRAGPVSRRVPLAGLRSLSIQSSPSGTIVDSSSRHRRTRAPNSDACRSP